MPIGGAAVHLRPRASVDRYRVNARLLQDLRELHAVAVSHIPAAAEFRRDGRPDGPFDRFDNPRRQIRLAHERGAVAVVDYLPHRTAHIEVYNIGAGFR